MANRLRSVGLQVRVSCGTPENATCLCVFSRLNTGTSEELLTLHLSSVCAGGRRSVHSLIEKMMVLACTFR